MSPSPHRVPSVSRKSRLAVAAYLATAASAATAAIVVGGSPAHAESAALSPTGSVLVTLRGNGHGHGMSQYGAQGAAVKGLNFQQILRFYYPGTSAAAIAPSTIRVRLSGFGSTLTVAADQGLQATGVGTVPTTGYRMYRYIVSGNGVILQRLANALRSPWRTVRTGLGNGAAFTRVGASSTRLFGPSGASTRYFGVVKIFRSGAGAYLVNRTSLDNYTAGVVSSEMPTSWRAQAVNAQAVAARSYGRYAVEHASHKTYDICDTTQCQVYGGRARYGSSGHRISSDYQRAAVATANRVLRYQGKTIFAQFAASNGGYVSDGGKPYLRAKADPYDLSAPGNPYINYTRTVRVKSLAGQYGFSKLTGIAIVQRDGGGAWGGRVESAILTGRAGKSAKRVTLSGSELQWAIGAGTTLFTVRRG